MCHNRLTLILPGAYLDMNPLTRARWIIVIVGILLPYLARIPGMFVYGPEWLWSYLDVGLDGLLFIGAFNAINWGTVLLMTLNLKHARAAWYPAVLGFALPVFLHASLDLSSDAQAGIALIFIPIFGIPGAIIGGALGHKYDRRLLMQSQGNTTDPN